MRAVIQRVLSASVAVDGEVVSSIGPGLMVLVGVREGDTRDDMEWLANKVIKARLFESAEGKAWGASVAAAEKEVLFVSQFTLYGSFAKGNKPDLHNAMPPSPAKAMYEAFLQHVRDVVYPEGAHRIKDGVFGAMMQVSLVNDGPVTMVLDSNDRKG